MYAVTVRGQVFPSARASGGRQRSEARKRNSLPAFRRMAARNASGHRPVPASFFSLPHAWPHKKAHVPILQGREPKLRDTTLIFPRLAARNSAGAKTHPGAVMGAPSAACAARQSVRSSEAIFRGAPGFFPPCEALSSGRPARTLLFIACTITQFCPSLPHSRQIVNADFFGSYEFFLNVYKCY